MVAVGCDDGVGRGEGRFHADGDGFLAIVEVAEAADELGFVEEVGRELGAAEEGEGAEEGEEFGGGGGDRGGWGSALVGDKGVSFDGEGRGGEAAKERGGRGGEAVEERNEHDGFDEEKLL